MDAIKRGICLLGNDRHRRTTFRIIIIYVCSKATRNPSSYSLFIISYSGAVINNLLITYHEMTPMALVHSYPLRKPFAGLAYRFIVVQFFFRK